ncbi:MAG: glycosyltransferase family 4 protein [Candidatus Magasanikbacteria bacterium]|nr:glycosyltransferase family 4 protein [Candidatus Magasanikbacteria bacterium]
MKILYLITKSEQGGAQTHVAQLMKHFKEKDWDITLMSSSQDGWLGKKAADFGVDFIPSKYLTNTINPLKVWKSFLEIRKVVNKTNPDIVHCHSFFAGFLGRLAVKGKYPTIFTPHGWGFNVGVSFFRKHFAIQVERFSSRFTNKILCVSEYGKKLAIQYKIDKPEKFIVIYNGIEDVLPTIECAKTLSEKVNFVFVGRLTEPKKPSFLLKAITLLPEDIKQKVNVTIIGKGEKEKEIKEFIIKNNLEKTVILKGLLSREDVFDQLCNKTDVFTLFSKWEGLPITILEAMSASLPVVASKVGGIPELVSKTNGFLIERDDINSLVNAITTLVKESDLRIEMGKNSRKKIQENFTLSIMFSKVEEEYNNLLK